MLKLSEIVAPIQPQLARVDEILNQTVFNSNHDGLKKVHQDVLEIPGKRLRPALFLLCYYSLLAPSLDQVEALCYTAAAIELIHMASLVHDDINDKADTRHNKPSVVATWGQPIAMTMGVYLYAIALDILTHHAPLSVVREIGLAVKEMCEGELSQILERNNPELGFDVYMAILDKKTASLFAATCKSAALFAERDDNLVADFDQLGRCFGLGFQISDDYLDFVDLGDHLGKKPGQDFELGEMTLPIFYLLNDASQSEKVTINHHITSKSSEGFEALRAMLSQSSAIEKTRQKAECHLAQALTTISSLQSSPYRESLNAVAQGILDRVYVKAT